MFLKGSLVGTRDVTMTKHMWDRLVAQKLKSHMNMISTGVEERRVELAFEVTLAEARNGTMIEHLRGTFMAHKLKSHRDTETTDEEERRLNIFFKVDEDEKLRAKMDVKDLAAPAARWNSHAAAERLPEPRAGHKPWRDPGAGGEQAASPMEKLPVDVARGER